MLKRNKKSAPNNNYNVQKHREDVEYALKLVEYVATLDDGMFLFLAILNGIGFTRVGMDLSKPHNHRAVVDAIHIYLKNNPNKRLMNTYKRAMQKSISAISGVKAVDRIFDILIYEFYLEDNHMTEDFLDLDGFCETIEELEKKNVDGCLYDHRRQKVINLVKQRAMMQSAAKADKAEAEI